MPFEVKESTNANEVKLEVNGVLDESAALPDIDSGRIIRLDLHNLKGINSIGVRNFIRWGDSHKGAPAIRLENCPSIFVKNFTMIKGFFKPNMVLISFVVPFYSESTGESQDITLLREKDFQSDGRYTIPSVKDSKGNPMEIDVDPKSFFEFFKK